MKGKVYVGSIGTEILANAGIDLTGATVSLLVLKPNGTEVTWAGEVFETTCVRHTAVPGDLNIPGVYRVQPQILAADDSWESPGNTDSFKVFSKFE